MLRSVYTWARTTRLRDPISRRSTRQRATFEELPEAIAVSTSWSGLWPTSSCAVSQLALQRAHKQLIRRAIPRTPDGLSPIDDQTSSDQLCVLDIDRKCPVIYAYNCDNKSRSVDEVAYSSQHASSTDSYITYWVAPVYCGDRDYIVHCERWAIKGCHFYFYDNIGKCGPASISRSLLHSELIMLIRNVKQFAETW